MTLKQFYVFIEGNDDERLFDYVLNHYLYKKLSKTKIHPIKYAERKDKEVNNYIRSFKKSSKFDYIFLSDLDSHNGYDGITSRIDKRMGEYPELEKEKIIIVKEAIESWYIAGVNNSFEKLKNKSLPEKSDEFTKKEFNALIEDVSDSRIDAMVEIAKSFNCLEACDKNSSFNYFSEKIGIKCHF